MGSAGSEFDHVVVGAGSAGCAIARRLVDAGRSVALVEAGGRDDNPAIRDPGRAWELWNSEVDYAYTTEPQVHAAGTRVFWPRGKVLGGSGSLNGMIYVRGHHADYDNWAYNGAAGWSYDEVLPYFRRSEDFEDGASQYHGTGGPLPVTRNHDPNPVSVAFVEACTEYGLPYNGDCNGAEMLGAGLAHRNIRGGKRATAWTAFVLPVLGNPPLTVLTCALVTRVLFDGSGRVVGVEMSRDGVISQLHAGGEVFLSGGVIGSAQLMLLSGIGAGGDLRALDGPRGRTGTGVRTREEIAAYIRRALLSYHHQVGTCRMGIDRLAVVDPSLRVHGVPGLRVADASVMPAVTSGNTNAATIMIGERCADIILTAADVPTRAAAASETPREPNA